MTVRALWLVLAAVACQPNNGGQATGSVTPAQREAIADTVSKATTDFLATMRSLDADKAATFDSRSSDYTFIGEDGSVCRTPEVCQKANKDGWKGVRSLQIRTLDSKVAVPSPTVAVETMSIAGTVVDTAGKAHVVDKGAFTIVWVRETDGWKMLSFHQSFLPPKTQ